MAQVTEQDKQKAAEIADTAVPPEQHGVKSVIRELVAQALANTRDEERERCAKIAESFNQRVYNGSIGAPGIAAAIRQDKE